MFDILLTHHNTKEKERRERERLTDGNERLTISKRFQDIVTNIINWIITQTLYKFEIVILYDREKSASILNIKAFEAKGYISSRLGLVLSMYIVTLATRSKIFDTRSLIYF